jgi:ATP-dependent helicase STH1/SNF2
MHSLHPHLKAASEHSPLSPQAWPRRTGTEFSQYVASFRPQIAQLGWKPCLQRANVLRSKGATPETHDELARITKFMQSVGYTQSMDHFSLLLYLSSNTVSNVDRPHQPSEYPPPAQQPFVNGHNSAANGVKPPSVPSSSITSGPVPSQPHPQPSRTPVSFTPDQINALRAQIHAFKLISRGLPVPETIQNAIRVPNNAIPDLERLLQGQDVSARVIDSAVKIAKGTESTPSGTIEAPSQDSLKVEDQDIATNAADLPKGPFMEDDVNSGIYPYNAYRHPFTHLKRNPSTDPSIFATRLQRLLIPSIMPAGLDAHQIMAERDRFIETRIQQRIRELEAMPATMGEGSFDAGLDGVIKEDKENASAQILKGPFTFFPGPNAHGKLRATIELKGLRVLEKQRALRALVAERLTHGSLLPLNRADFRRTRKPTIRDARTTEQLERKQRADRERRAKHKHVEQLGVICSHGREVLAVNRAAQDRIIKLGRAVLSFHATTEKEEQKRIERISKERLKALKADDEEAYMKLIDTAKDTRITHLLRQTDTYLDSLAQAVVAQQSESSSIHDDLPFETEEGPTSEATFGAQVLEESPEEKAKVDYYAVAHRISEKVSRQPRLLTGGTLKEYQLKGLQWMVSLYNNRLNGILADEMVSDLLAFEQTMRLTLLSRVSAKRSRRFP